MVTGMAIPFSISGALPDRLCFSAEGRLFFILPQNPELIFAGNDARNVNNDAALPAQGEAMQRGQEKAGIRQAASRPSLYRCDYCVTDG